MGTINVELKPFMTPNFVCAAEPAAFGDRLSFALRDVDAAILDRMCAEWRAEVFRKAGKPDPQLEPRKNTKGL